MGLTLSSEVGSLSLRRTDPCAEGVQFSSVEDVLLRSDTGLEAEGNSSPLGTSGKAVLVLEDGRAEGLLPGTDGAAEG